MTKRRSTPLKSQDIKGHHCTLNLRMEKLGMVPFFQQLSAKELGQVEKRFSASHSSAGDTIYHQGEKATLLRVVVHGAVKLLRHTRDGKDVLLEMLKPGDYFGNLSASTEDVYSETAQAQTDVCILAINMRDFRSLLDDYSGVAWSVLNITANRLQSSQEQIEHLTSLPVKNRIAHLIIMLCDKFGEKSSRGQLIQLPLSRKELADMAGTSTETASRIMSTFQDEGLITSGRQWVAVTDISGLKNIAKE